MAFNITFLIQTVYEGLYEFKSCAGILNYARGICHSDLGDFPQVVYDFSYICIAIIK